MSEKMNSFPVFTMLHEERTVSATVSDNQYIDTNTEIKLDLESKELQENNLTQIGTAYVQKDGSIYVQLYAIPINGKLVMKVTKP